MIKNLTGHLFFHPALIVMMKVVKRIFKALRTYPFSLGAFFITTLPWILVCMIQINITSNPAPEHHSDYRSEGAMFGAIFAILLAIVMIIITTLNLIFQKNKDFYAGLLAAVIVINIASYIILII